MTLHFSLLTIFLLQRVEKELQEKAAAQLLPGKREAGDGGEFAAAERQDRWANCDKLLQTVTNIE